MKRKPDESFDAYKKRRKQARRELRKHLKGKLAWNSGIPDVRGDKSYRKKKMPTT